jgi:hypothetical protein
MPGCERLFSMLYRRHHCRKCGRVVCSACSKKRIELFDHDNSVSRGRTERVCRECCQLSTLSEEIAGNSPLTAARAAEQDTFSPVPEGAVPQQPQAASAGTLLAADQLRGHVLGGPSPHSSAGAPHTTAAIPAGRCVAHIFVIHAEVH